MRSCSSSPARSSRTGPTRRSPQLEILNVLDGLFGDVFGFLARYYPKINRFDREPRNITELHARLLDSCMCRLTFDQVRTQMGDRAPKGVARQSTAVEMHGKAADRVQGRSRQAARLPARSPRGDRPRRGDDDRGCRAGRLRQDRALHARRGARAARGAPPARRSGQGAERDQLRAEPRRSSASRSSSSHGTPTSCARSPSTSTLARSWAATRSKKIEEAKERFQAGLDKVIVLNIVAGGTGHTLTAANQVVFAEFPWTPADYAQARLVPTASVRPSWSPRTHCSQPTASQHDRRGARGDPQQEGQGRRRAARRRGR